MRVNSQGHVSRVQHFNNAFKQPKHPHCYKPLYRDQQQPAKSRSVIYESPDKQINNAISKEALNQLSLAFTVNAIADQLIANSSLFPKRDK